MGRLGRRDVSKDRQLRLCRLGACAVYFLGLRYTSATVCSAGWVLSLPSLGKAPRVVRSVAFNSVERRLALLVAPAVILPVPQPSRAVSSWSPTQLPLRSIDEVVDWLKRNDAKRLPMARYPDPVLRIAAKPVLQITPRLAEVARALQNTAVQEGAVGLAANQAGIDARIIVLDPNLVGKDVPAVMVNPRIVERSPEEEMRFWRELCLVLPDDVRVTLMRDNTVTIEFTDLSGKTSRTKLRDEAARAFQHEFDHLNGILILDHATDPNDLQSSVFPDVFKLERSDHERRQARAFSRDA